MIAIIMIVGYIVVVTLIGSLFARRTRSAKEWAVAGGGMSTAMIAFGIAGTRIGGAGTYGVAGNVITDGTWYLWWYGINTFLAMALVGFFFAKPYRRLELNTVSETFWIRFRSSRSQWITSLCVQTEYFIVDIIEAYLIGSILTAVVGLPFELTVFIAAAILITYTALGGLWGSAVTNLIHCAVIIVGLLAVILFGMNELGGWASVTEKVSAQLTAAGKDEASWWSWVGGGWGAILGMFFSATIHTPAASIYVNFSSAAKNEKALVPAFLLGGLIGAVMPVLAGIIGIETLAQYGAKAGLTGYTNITRLATDINPIVGGVAVAAVLAAVISSGGPILLSSVTLFVQDWMPSARKFTPERRLKTFRVVTIIYGVVAAIGALGVRAAKLSLLDILLFGFAMVVPPALAIGFLFYWKRTTERGAYWGMLAGYGAGLVWFGLIQWAVATGFSAPEGSGVLRRLFHWCFVYDGKGIDPSYATTLVPLILVPLISLLTREDTEGKAEFYEKLAIRRRARELETSKAG